MKLNQYGMTTGWIFFTWACFVSAICASAYAIFNANIDITYKLLFSVIDILLIQSSISLSKMIRDKAEYDSVQS